MPTLDIDIDIDQAKAALRRTARNRRTAVAGRVGATAAACVAGHFLSAIPVPGEAVGTAVVAGYWPIGAELDSRPLMAALHGRGVSCALPVVVGEGRALSFRRWRPGERLEPGPFGTRHPGPAAPAVEPTLVLVPLLAFDDDGWRLGQGGGYYDRTLAAGTAVAVGLAFAAQRVDRVPRAPHDRRLDWIVTEDGARHPGNG